MIDKINVSFQNIFIIIYDDNFINIVLLRHFYIFKIIF